MFDFDVMVFVIDVVDVLLELGLVVFEIDVEGCVVVCLVVVFFEWFVWVMMFDVVWVFEGCIVEVVDGFDYVFVDVLFFVLN